MSLDLVSLVLLHKFHGGFNLQAAFDEVAAKTGLSKMMMGLFGSVSMEDLEFDATDAEFKTRSTTVLAREAALSDRYAASRLMDMSSRKRP